MNLAETPPRVRLQRMSRWMRALIAAGAVALVAAIGWIWFGDPSLIERRMRELAGMPVLDLPTAVRPGLMLLSALGVALCLFILAQAWQLFGAYGRGQVFGPAAIVPVRRIAWALLAGISGGSIFAPEALAVVLFGAAWTAKGRWMERQG